MKYYKTGTNRTVKLEWDNSNVSNYYSGSEKLGILWKELYMYYDNHNRPIKINGIKDKRNVAINYPSNHGKIQYRAYACKPKNYKQLMSGLRITPKDNWWSIARRVHGIKQLGYPTNSSDPKWCCWCRPIYIIAFFIPSPYDRLVTDKPSWPPPCLNLRATYSTLKKIIVCPPCLNENGVEEFGHQCKNNQCANFAQLLNSKCDCPENLDSAISPSFNILTHYPDLGIGTNCNQSIQLPTALSNCLKPGPNDDWDYENLQCIPPNTYGYFRLRNGSIICIDP